MRNIKKLSMLGLIILTLLVCMCFVAGAVSDTVVDSGECGADGDNVTWVLYGDGELVIGGDGEMMNYTSWDSPFYRNYDIRNIVIEYGVTSIGDLAFFDCRNVESISLSDSVISIGQQSFYWCEKISTIYIPKTITNINNKAFVDCRGLTAIIVDEDNEYYSNDENGVLFDKEKNVVIYYPVGNNRTSYIIPTGVTNIGFGAFDGAINLASIVIPNSVETIEGFAFNDCMSLNSIVIPDGVTTIEWCAFQSCTNLKWVKLPESLTTVGDNVFSICVRLESVSLPLNLSYIGEGLFNYCLALKNIFIPNTITQINEDMFRRCESLEDVYYIGNQNDWDKIVIKNENSNNDPLLNATIHFDSVICDHINTENVAAIEESCILDGYTVGVRCKDCEAWLEGHETIVARHLNDNDDQFCDRCDRMMPIESGFCGNTAPENYSGGASVKYYLYQNGTLEVYGDGIVAYEYFSYDENIINVIIREGVVGIDNASFYSCYNLSNITIPKSLISIETEAFSDCYLLENAYYAGNEDEWDNVYIGENNEPLLRTKIHFETVKEDFIAKGECGDQGDNITWVLYDNGELIISGEGEMDSYDLGFSPFSNNNNIKSVVIENGITNISYGMFYSSSNIESVKMPETIKEIDGWAFYLCESLTEIELPKGLQSIGEIALASCNIKYINIPRSLTDIHERAFEDNPIIAYSVDDSHPYYCSDDNGIIFNKDKTVLIKYPAGRENASYDIPNSVIDIYNHAFYNSLNLECVNIPSSVVSLGEYAFAACVGFKEISIPDSITTIEPCSFAWCRNLEKVNLPNTIKYISNGAFQYCLSLKDIKLPNSLVSIGAYAFESCETLIDIKLPNRISKISWNLFAFCSNLESVYIPNSVDVIEEDSFYDCEKLSAIYYQGTEEDWNNIAIESSNDELNNIVIYFDVGCKHTEDGYEIVITKDNIVDATYDKPGSYEEVVICKNCDAELGRETKDIPALWLSNISFEFADNTLIISGTGNIPELGNTSDYPWSKHAMETDAIYLVGVNAVSSSAFEDFISLRFLMIDSEEITIKKSAFANSDFLYSVVTFGDTIVEEGAFSQAKIYSESGKTVSGYDSVEFSYGDNIVHFNGDVNVSKDDLYALIGATYYRYGKDYIINAIKFNQFRSDEIRLVESLAANKPVEYPLTNATVYVCVGTSESDLERKTFNDFAMGGYLGDSDAVIRFCVETPVNEEEPEESLTFIEKVINKIRSFFTTIKFWLKKLFGIVS